MNGARGQHSNLLQRANWPGALLVFGCVLFLFFVCVSEKEKALPRVQVLVIVLVVYFHDTS